MAVKKEINKRDIKNKVEKNKKQDEIIIPKKIIKKKWWILVLPLIVSIIIYILLPEIILKGNRVITISYDEVYKEPGYKGRYIFKDITKKIKVDNHVINGQVGEYEIIYKMKYYGMIFKNKRTVMIVDKDKPEILVDSNQLLVCPNGEPIPKYEASDKYDGSLNDKVITKIDNDKLLLSVKDSSNNEATLTLDLIYEDREAPVINLKGDNKVYLNTGVRYNEPGYSASDNCDNDITDKVQVSGSVGINAGTYKITYTVMDEAGNKGEVVREVIVRNSNLYNSGSINNGSIYLTFDDGPSEGTTNKILDILAEEGVKATFFVTCNGPDYLIKRIHDEGHTIALHTATHDYSYIYSSVDNYFNDLNRVANRVKNITGEDAKIIRFPGGSSNTVSRNYSYGIMSTLTGMVLDRGYRYFDWNVDAMDASSARSSSDVFYNVSGHLSTSRANVVLMHDTKGITRDALKDIIRFGKNNGYSFSRITMDTYMIRHGVNN